MADSPFLPRLRKPLHLHGFWPGDVVGFSACNPTSAVIRACTGGIICCGGLSHVGFVTWWDGRKWLNPERRFVLCESTSQCDEPCLIQEKHISGVQVHHLRARILAYPGRVYHYPLTQRLDWAQTIRLFRWCHKHLGDPYDYRGAADARHTSLARLIRRLRGEDLDKVFCSEHVAAAHRKLELLETDNASQFSPNRLVRTERQLGILQKPRRIK